MIWDDGQALKRQIEMNVPQSNRETESNLFTQSHILNFWQWLFRRRRQFALGIYFAIIIHVYLYNRICYNYTSDTVV